MSSHRRRNYRWFLLFTAFCATQLWCPSRPVLAASADELLLLFHVGPLDPLLEPLQQDLSARAHKPDNSWLESGDLLVGPLPKNTAAWLQASALARASLWFMLGKQCLAARNDPCALNAFEAVRVTLYSGGLLPRAQLLASLSLITGRIRLELGDEPGADAAFRMAGFIDPNDNSANLPEGAARERYQAARRWVLDSPRLPVRIETNAHETTLYVNGSRANGGGPSWVLELPPGEHILSATRDGMLTAASGCRLDVDAPRPEVGLRLQPGSGSPMAARPFSLAEATGFMQRLREVVEEHGASRAILEAVVGPVDGRQVRGPGPRAGHRSGIQVKPGPDPGDEPPSPVPMKVELFQVDRHGRITYLGTSIVEH